MTKKRTPDERSVLRAVEKSRGRVFVNKHEPLILQQARRIGELPLATSTWKKPSLPLHYSFMTLERAKQLGLYGDTVTVVIDVPARTARATRAKGAKR